MIVSNPWKSLVWEISSLAYELVAIDRKPLHLTLKKVDSTVGLSKKKGGGGGEKKESSSSSFAELQQEFWWPEKD